jgi:TP901 family phage tail tape measure protein
VAVYALEIRLEGIDDLSPVLQRAEREVGRVSRDIGGSLQGVQRDLREVARAGEQSMQRVGRSMSNLGERIRRTADDIRPLGFALAGIGAAITGAIGVGVARFASFEQAMANVRAVSGATDEEFQALEAEARRIGETMGRFTAQDAAEGLLFLSMAGLDARQSVGALEPTLKLAQAAQVEMAEAGDILTNIMTGMMIPVEDLTRVNDVLIKGFTSSNTNLQMLGEAFGYAAGSARAAGLTVEETTAILGLFANAGIRGSRAGTTLEAMLRQMARVTPQAQRELRRLGVTLTDAEGNFLPMPAIVRQFEEALAGVPGEAERLRILSVIFGQAGARGINALLAQGSDRLEEFTRELNNAAGTADRVAAIQTATLQEAFGELTSAIEGAALTIGGVFAPAVEFAADSVKGVVGVFNSMPRSLQVVASILLAMVGVLFSVAGAAILLLGPFGSLLTGFGRFMQLGIVQWFGRLAATIVTRVVPAMVSLVISMGPIGIALLAVAAVIGVFALAWTLNWGGIREKTKAAVDAIVGFFKGLWSAVTGVVTAVVGFVRENWQEIATVLSLFVGGPLAAFGVAWATNAFGIRETVGGLVESIRTFFADLAGSALEIGRSIVTGLWQGISSGIGGLLENVQNAGRSVLDAMKSGLGKLWPFSPSEAGVDIGSGLVLGISAGIRDAQRQLNRDLASIERKVTGDLRGRVRVGRELALAGAGGVTVNGPLVSFQNVQVRSDSDLDEIARRTARELGNVRRGMT